MVCSQDLPYPDVIETIAQQMCQAVILNEVFKGIHQPGYEELTDKSQRAVCQGIKSKDTSRWTRSHTAKERCDATKEGFVRLCWCSTDEHVFQFTPLDLDDQVSPRPRVLRPFSPRRDKPTTWCVKYAPSNPHTYYDIFSFKEVSRNGLNRPTKSLTLTANWDTIWLAQKFSWTNSQGTLQNVIRWVRWSVPYSYKPNTWRVKDHLRLVCLRFDMMTGNVTLWYKQPGHFMVTLTPILNTVKPYKSFLLPGTVALGRSLTKVGNMFRQFDGLIVYALITDMFNDDISHAHSTYNCMIPHLYSNKRRRNTRYTLTWADFSPADSREPVTGVTVLDRYSSPDIITASDVCGSCFVKERDDLDSEIDLMAATKDNNDTETFCHNISRAMLLWEDNAYCWQVDHTSGAASFETKTQPYPRMITMYNELRRMGIDPKVSCSFINETVQQNYTSPPPLLSSNTIQGTNFTRTFGSTMTTPFSTMSFTTTVPGPSHDGNLVKLYYAFPFSGSPEDEFLMMGSLSYLSGMTWKPPKHPRNNCDMALFQLICFDSIEITDCENPGTKRDIRSGARRATSFLVQHRCEKTHLQWRLDRRSKVMRDLEECSIWNLSECRWRHMVGRRFSRYYFTSNLNWLWDSEIRDFRYSTKEDSCTHRKEYGACLKRLNCNNDTLKEYNSTSLADKLLAELHQYNLDYYMEAMPKYIGPDLGNIQEALPIRVDFEERMVQIRRLPDLFHIHFHLERIVQIRRLPDLFQFHLVTKISLRREWCNYADPLNKVHSDCPICFSLLKHLNTTSYWSSYQKSIAVFNTRGCPWPQCTIRGTVVPPSFSERLYLQDAKELAGIIEEEKAGGLKGSGESLRTGVVVRWVILLRYFGAFV
ncbi:uncharacterized protein LOC134818643 [Bolinopsis microptera]|uniref:uncharacterized protein LOC134818643 n=1 Tax=Bolinopsis microptera TaxID=2820187 RepID=UPI00307921A7